jgi:hypothetical protein
MFAAPARQASARLSVRISPAYRVMDVNILCMYQLPLSRGTSGGHTGYKQRHWLRTRHGPRTPNSLRRRVQRAVVTSPASPGTIFTFSRGRGYIVQNTAVSIKSKLLSGIVLVCRP